MAFMEYRPVIPELLRGTCLRAMPRYFLKSCSPHPIQKTSIYTLRNLFEGILTWGIPMAQLSSQWFFKTFSSKTRCQNTTGMIEAKHVFVIIIFVVAKNFGWSLFGARNHFIGCVFFLVSLVTWQKGSGKVTRMGFPKLSSCWMCYFNEDSPEEKHVIWLGIIFPLKHNCQLEEEYILY